MEQLDPTLAEAIDRHREAATSAPRTATAFAEGTVLLAAGRAGLAAERFTEALQAGPSPLQLKMLHGLGQAWYRQGRHAEAERIFALIVEHTTALLDPFVWLGLALLAQDRPAEALAVHRRALALHPGHPEIARVYADGAVALHRLDRPEEGLAWCCEAVEERGLRDPVLVSNLAAFRRVLAAS